jgi:hypothetical protein
MFAVKVSPSTVAETVAVPGELPAVKVEVAVPPLKLLGLLAVPRDPPLKVAGVPLGTLCPVSPFESVSMLAVSVEVPSIRIEVGEAAKVITSHGLSVRVEEFAEPTVSHPEAPGPPLQPHQFSVTVALPLNS